LFLIPSDRALVNAQHYLASSANCSRVLKKRLQPVMNDFGLIVIDSPPQKNHINLTAIGAADVVIIPAEAVAKGIGSLTETWALLEECREGDAFDGQIIGVLPFRARVVGVQLTGEASESLSAMRSFSGDVVLPAVVESVVYQRAINYGKLPSEVNAAKAELEQPFDVLLQRLSPYVSGMEVAIAEVVPA
jgi:chromosome partitioning protein